MNRAGFLASAAALALAPAARAAAPSELDLAVARFAVGAEILAAEFYRRAIASKKFVGDGLTYLRRALVNEQEHLAAVSQIITGAGEVPSTADDFDITFPKASFASRASIAKLGVTLETVLVGAYLGAVDEFAPGDLKTTAARIAANEAEHLSVLSARRIGGSLPAPIDYATASGVLDAYLS